MSDRHLGFLLVGPSLVCLLVACNVGTSLPDARSDADVVDAATDSGTVTSDAPTDGAVGDGSSTVTITTPTTNGSISLAFDVTIDGTEPTTGMTASVTHNVGTLAIDGGNYPVVVYEKIPWSTFNTVLYQAIAVRPDRWDVIWFYCSGTTLTTIDIEDTTGTPLVTLNAAGTCMETNTTVQTAVQAPASTLPLDSLVQGFTVAGPHLSYTGMAPGTMTYAGASWSVYPFSLIDCSTGCGSPGWYELHSIYWNASSTCFGIFYLESNMLTAVPLEYTLCLPGVTTGTASFASSWSQP